MKKLSLFILIVGFVLGVSFNTIAITPAELNVLAAGDFIHVKLEWNGKIYLEGDAVVGYVKDNAAVVISIEPDNPFYYGASAWAITEILPNPVVKSLTVENNLLKIDNNLLRETIKNSNVGVMQVQIDMLKVKLNSLGTMLLESQAQLNSKINSMLLLTK